MNITSLVLLCCTACAGEISFEWKGVPISAQKQVETAVKAAALKFTEKKYAERRVYDFINSPTQFTVRFEDLQWLGGTYSAARENYEKKNLVTLDIKLTKNHTALKILALHEFSHAYDDMLPEKSSCGINCFTEPHAQNKEELFIQKLKNYIPAGIYQKYMQRHKSSKDGDIRRKALLELMER